MGPFDYIIVGAGSAGCVVANRLSAEAGNKVLLLEAGPRDSSLWFSMPLGYTELLKSTRYNWQFPTEYDEQTGRAHVWPRGKALGGSSSINAMIYTRGNRGDYDGWAQMGLAGWSWDDVLPWFQKAENYVGSGPVGSHGQGGPLTVSDPAYVNPMSKKLLDAAEQAGIPQIDDPYSGEHEGGYLTHFTIRDGKRASTARAYLAEAEKRANLTILTDALAHRLLFDGRRATGLRFARRGKIEQVEARAGIILCGGAINSPHLLELSGIGDAEHLKTLGIEPVHHLPGVGANLQDHFNVAIGVEMKPGTPSINREGQGLGLVKSIARYALTKKGMMAVGPAHFTLYAKTRPELEWPDLQYHGTPATLEPDSYNRNEIKFYKAPGMTIGHCVVRPESRGSIHAASPDPTAYPAIRPNYLSAGEDREATVRGFHIARRIFEQPAIRDHVAHEIQPGREVASDEDLLTWAREKGNTIYHPVGTCRMGPDGDPQAVLDGNCRVRGVDGLHVIDASVMPRLISGNTNAPTIMIAEKAAAALIAQAKQQRAA